MKAYTTQQKPLHLKIPIEIDLNIEDVQAALIHYRTVCQDEIEEDGGPEKHVVNVLETAGIAHAADLNTDFWNDPTAVDDDFSWHQKEREERNGH